MFPCHASSSKHNCSQPRHLHNRLEGETPDTGVISSISFKPPLCSEGLDFNIQMQLSGAANYTQTARQSEERAGGAVGALWETEGWVHLSVLYLIQTHGRSDGGDTRGQSPGKTHPAVATTSASDYISDRSLVQGGLMISQSAIKPHVNELSSRDNKHMK